MWPLILFLLIIVSGCEHEELNSSNSQPIQRLSQESLPGKAEYERACATCHDGSLKKAPHRDMIALMTPGSIFSAMTKGVMQTQASNLSDKERQQIAEYLSGGSLGQTVKKIPACQESKGYREGSQIVGSNWGVDLNNTRYISSDIAGLDSTSLGDLAIRWAIAMPGSTRVRSQPAFGGGLVFVGSHSGSVYALDPDTGCAVWEFAASGEVRTSISVSEENKQPMIYFGDVLANVYGVKSDTGELVWKIKADDHPNATITGSPTFYGGNLYIPISSLEVSNAIDPYYECCTFRGSVLAVDGLTGKEVWKTYTIVEKAGVTGKNKIGVDVIGPSGAVVWNSPSIDKNNNQLFVGTGENMSSPATGTSDALIAMDLNTGEINWVFQATENDAWNVSCGLGAEENCPVENGPDFDFGGATIVLDTSAHGPLVIAGQKSGFVHAVKSITGELVWQTRVGRGGIQGGIHFGIAARDETIFVPISDMEDGKSYPDPDRPGMNAVDANTGKIIWSTLHDNRCGGREFCHPGISQVVTVIGDMVLGGAMDGIIRAYAIDNGKILWELDTTKNEYSSITGAMAFGGSFGGAAGPIASDGLLLISSGYGLYNHMPGNLLLALEAREISD
ncbi:MAG: hypothetical protein CMQ40_10935 [Gammaproteobacteria bacterium]|nr:hypothetical protein [Gammaproteobacteria bacterium]